MIERTLAILKPDALQKQVVGDIIQRYEKIGLKPIAMKILKLSKQDAEGFYAVHRKQPFFNDLTSSLASGPVLVLVLEGENAILRNRDVMGATDPKKAKVGTIRAAHGSSIEANTVHGSDAPDTAKFEMGYFFAEMDLPSR